MYQEDAETPFERHHNVILPRCSTNGKGGVVEVKSRLYDNPIKGYTFHFSYAKLRIIFQTDKALFAY